MINRSTTSRRFALCALAVVAGLGITSGSAFAAEEAGSASKPDPVATTGGGGTALAGPAPQPGIDMLCAPPMSAEAGRPIAVSIGEAPIDLDGAQVGSDIVGPTTLIADTSVSIDPAIGCGIDTVAMNDEQHRIAEYLTGRGIAFTVKTGDGVDWVEIDHADQAAAEALEDYYWEQSPMPQDVIDAINADAEELAEFLRSRGFDVEVTTDRHGVRTAVFDYNADDVSEALTDFYWAKYPMSQAEIDALNAEAERLAAFLSEQGIDAALATDRHGLTSVDVDWGSAEVQKAMDAYFTANPMPREPMAIAVPAVEVAALSVAGNG